MTHIHWTECLKINKINTRKANYLFESYIFAKMRK